MSELLAAAAAIRADITRGRWLGYEWTMGSMACGLDHAAEACGLNRSPYVEDAHKTAHEVARAYLSEQG